MLTLDSYQRKFIINKEKVDIIRFIQKEETMDIIQPIKKDKVDIKKIASKSIEILILLLLSAIFIFPFIWMLSTSFKNPQEMMQLPPTIIPNDIVLENYSTAWHSGPFFRYLLNSVFVTGSVLIVLYTTCNFTSICSCIVALDYGATIWLFKLDTIDITFTNIKVAFK